MQRNRRVIVVAGLGVAALIAMPGSAQRSPDSGPVARYDMRAGTVSGFAGMGAGGMMGAMLGGGGDQVQHELYLRLGSSQAPVAGAPKADHFMPAGARLGKSVALATPKEERAPEDFPQGRKPKGRMLLFWGCGEHAPKGQPVVIDFARLAAGQVPPGLWTTTIIRDLGPTMQNSRTFGRWPAEDHKFVKPDSSLLGAHRVAGNYSPEMSFTLANDFMQPLRVTASGQSSGASLIRWGTLPNATGYLATLIGGKSGPGGEMSDMVMWTSSAGRQFGGGLSDWLSPGQVAALVRDRTVMAPATSQCLIPAEVTQAAPDFRMGTLTAFGPEEDFAYPPRPTDPKARWDLQWTARIRHRSLTSWMDMPGMGQAMGQSGPEQQQQPAEKPKCNKRGGLGGLGGIVSGVLGSGC